MYVINLSRNYTIFIVDQVTYLPFHPPDSHVDGGNGVKTVVYNTKEDSKKRGTEKKKIQEKKREEKVEEIQQ